MPRSESLNLKVALASYSDLPAGAMEALGSSRRTTLGGLFLEFRSQDVRVLQDPGCRDVEPGHCGFASLKTPEHSAHSLRAQPLSQEAIRVVCS